MASIVPAVPTRVADELCSDDEMFSQVLHETVSVLERAGIAYALIGGIASTSHGRPRWTHDIDVFVKPEEAERALQCLARAGFNTEKLDPRWLYKAYKHNAIVDVIFRSTGEIRLDAEMLARAVELEFLGCRARFVAPEDLLVMKVIVNDETGSRHWHDALGLISASDLDWSYLLKRARRAPRRVLSLLIYAHSRDLHVPIPVIRELFEQIYGGA